MILEFRSVTKLLQRKPILEEMSFCQPSNVSIGVLGARGSGKTTLINLVLGATDPERGRICRQGRLSMPIGFPAMLNRFLTGEENARFLAGLYGLEARSVCAFVEEFSELGPILRQPLSSYNSTRRSRFHFALSYAIPADCYVADGVIFGGDSGFRDKCLAMAKAKRREAAFFFTTHSPRDMRLFADVGAVIQNRRLVFYPSVEAAIAAFGPGEDIAVAADAEPMANESEGDLSIDI